MGLGNMLRHLRASLTHSLPGLGDAAIATFAHAMQHEVATEVSHTVYIVRSMSDIYT